MGIGSKTKEYISSSDEDEVSDSETRRVMFMVVEDSDKEDSEEDQVQQVSPKTPSKRVQKNHPSDQIIGNKDVGVETRRKIRSPEPSTLI